MTITDHRLGHALASLHYAIHGDIHRRALPTTTLGWQILADQSITHDASP